MEPTVGGGGGGGEGCFPPGPHSTGCWGAMGAQGPEDPHPLPSPTLLKSSPCTVNACWVFPALLKLFYQNCVYLRCTTECPICIYTVTYSQASQYTHHSHIYGCPVLFVVRAHQVHPLRKCQVHRTMLPTRVTLLCASMAGPTRLDN